MVMNFPLPRRGAYLALRISNASRLPMNLNDSPWGTQYAQTRSNTDWALSRHADRWIFQPCGGSTQSAGDRTSQSSRVVRFQPSGIGGVVNSLRCTGPAVTES